MKDSDKQFVQCVRSLVDWFNAMGGPTAHQVDCECGGTSDHGKTWCGQQKQLIADLEQELKSRILDDDRKPC